MTVKAAFLSGAMAALVMGIAPAQSQNPPATGAIHGIVRGAGGAPLAGANVMLSADHGIVKWTRADRDGIYAFDSVAAGTYSVTSEAAGYRSARYATISLAANQARLFDFRLQPGTAAPAADADAAPPALTAPDGMRLVVGRVLNADGSPAIAIDVFLVPASGGQPPPAGKLLVGNSSGLSTTAPSMVSAVGRTDNAGWFQLERVPPGLYHLGVGVILKPECPPGADCFGGPVAFAPFVNEAQFSPTGPMAVSAGVANQTRFQILRRVSPTPVFKISGHVLGAIPAPRGNQMALAQVKLGSVTRRCAADQTEYGNPAMSITGGVTPDGVFEIREVPPGAYAVCVKSAGGPSGYGLVGYTTVDRDASGLTFKVAEAAPAGGPRGRGVIRP